ncbi:MAG: chromate transporter [Comamonadaceae bacterium]|nr:chromate transporter [Comamonadaceae bacterium]
MTDTTPPRTARARRRCGEAFRYWLKLGFISFGGPAGQISMMHQELVEKRRWISEHRFLHALNYCMLLPGPEAIQLAIYIGWLMHGMRGGIVAGVLFFLPSLRAAVALPWIYLAFGDVPLVAGVLLRHQAGGGRDRAVRRLAHRLARARRTACCWAHRRRRLRRHLRLRRRLPVRSCWRPASLGAIGGKLAPAKFKAGGGHGASRQVLRPGADRRRHAAAGACALHAGQAGRHARRRRHRHLGRGAGCSASAAGRTAARHGLSSSPRPPSSPSAAPTPCCPTSTRAASNTTAGSPARR